MIRPMRNSDWKSVAEIYQQGIDSGIATFTTNCPSFEEWDRYHHRNCRFVYEQDGKVVAWIAVSPTSSREVYSGNVEMSLYVDYAYHRRGIGTALIEHLKAEAVKAGYWSLYSVIFSINVASIELNRKCGFREIGYRERPSRDKFGNWQNTTLMEYRAP